MSESQQPIFIVGTGRCGSTILTKLLHQHPDILSISEFFTYLSDLGGRLSDVFTHEEVDGSQFWALLSAVMPREQTMIEHDLLTSEVLYPVGSPQARFSAETGVPSILQVTLPQLSEDHDALFASLGEYIQTLPKASIRQQYDLLFGWLQEKLHKKVWVERSGGSFVYIKDLFRLYPDARFVHIVRDGRNTALSMTHHLGFRMFWLASTMTHYLGVDPFESDNRDQLHKLPEEFHCFLPENFDREAFLEFQPPPEIFGQLWSDQIMGGTDVLSHVPSDKKMTIQYESLCEFPEENVKSLIEFIGVDADESRISEMAKMVKPSSASWLNLSEKQQQLLDKACAPGMRIMKDVVGR